MEGINVRLTNVGQVAFGTIRLHALGFAVPMHTFRRTGRRATATTNNRVGRMVSRRQTTFLVDLGGGASTIPTYRFQLRARFFRRVRKSLRTVKLFNIGISAGVMLAHRRNR